MLFFLTMKKFVTIFTKDMPVVDKTIEKYEKVKRDKDLNIRRENDYL